MNQNILHVGLDVDDSQYHGSDFNKETGEVIAFRCRPPLKVAETCRCRPAHEKPEVMQATA
jgi:hypothetical protein